MRLARFLRVDAIRENERATFAVVEIQRSLPELENNVWINEARPALPNLKGRPVVGCQLTGISKGLECFSFDIGFIQSPALSV